MADTLNLPCKACGSGKLIVDDYLNDNYTIGCSSCDNKMVMHYTSFDVLVDNSEHASQK